MRFNERTSFVFQCTNEEKKETRKQKKDKLKQPVSVEGKIIRALQKRLWSAEKRKTKYEKNDLYSPTDPHSPSDRFWVPFHIFITSRTDSYL